jgi:CelD/BcsL family acetyltransferase involved in cellulose biosynthesis
MTETSLSSFHLTETSLNGYHQQASAYLPVRDIFYYQPEWVNLLTRLYGYTVFPIITKNANSQLTGFLPVCVVKQPFVGKHLVALPFSDYCPLWAVDEASAHSLVDQAIELARRVRANYLELRCGPDPILAQRNDLVAVDDIYVRWLLPLAADPDAVWRGLRKPVQHQIKKSRQKGVKVVIAQQREDMLHYHRLHLQTRCRKHGMPSQPARFFLELWDRFAEQGKMQLLLAEYENTIIGGMILLASGTTVRYAYGASDSNYLHLAPNNLLMWTAITWGCEHGYKELDMGRTARDNEGLMEFKRRWGAVQEPLPYYYYPGKSGMAATSETSWRYRVLTACWKRLPLPIAEIAGNRLYRYLG